MISMLFLNETILKFLTIFPYLTIYSEPLCVTYASFGGGGSHMLINLPYITRDKLGDRSLHFSGDRIYLSNLHDFDLSEDDT